MFPAPPALADENGSLISRCLPRNEFAERLQNSFHETSNAHGISVDGTLLEIFVGPEGTFTVAKIMTNGVACIVDFGSDWQTTLHPADGSESSAGTVPETPIDYLPGSLNR
ncbi:MAG TPA: hypothetical protein VM659_23150 [Dongiaceae bacterium]|nr:hypothetical protein [Dongiaceae bacterium]